jgi:hypothetical protein
VTGHTTRAVGDAPPCLEAGSGVWRTRRCPHGTARRRARSRRHHGFHAENRDAEAICWQRCRDQSLVDEIPELQNNSAKELLDALAAGHPAMVNCGSWRAGLLVQTGAGIVVPSKDTGGGAELLVTLLHDPERRRTVRQAATTLAKDSSAGPTAERLQQNFTEVERSIPAGRRSGGLAPRRSEA